MVFWKDWSWEVQTEAMRHSWGFDQEVNLNSLAPGSLRDPFQSYLRDMLVLPPECGNCFRKAPQDWELCRARWHI